MKNTLLILAIILFLASCTGSKKATNSITPGNKPDASAQITDESDRDGSSYEKAIIIHEKTERTGVDAEYIWLAKNYPNYKFISQSLNFYKEHSYDILRFKDSTGKEREIYFDITNFFGKF